MQDLRIVRRLRKRLTSVSNDHAAFISWCAVTSFLLIERALHLPWDFLVYYLNALHWAGATTYTELARAPLASMLFLLFLPLGKIAAQAAFIISVSALFFWGSRRLAQALGIRHFIWYGLHINAFFLINATRNGTELLALSLLEAGIAAIVTGRKSGHWFGLAALARYASASWLVLILFQRRMRDRIQDLALFVLTFAPWLIYNKWKTGYALASIAENVAMNIKFRYYLEPVFDPFAILRVLNVLVPFAMMGILWIVAKWWTATRIRTAKLQKKHRAKKEVQDQRIHKTLPLLMVVLAALIISAYIRSPIRLDRYLYALVLPAAYFAYVAIRPHINKKSFVIGFSILIALQLLIAGAILLMPQYNQKNIYPDLLQDPLIKETAGCILHSNQWVLLTYNGRLSEPAPWKSSVVPYLEEGRYILLFKSVTEPEYIQDRSLWSDYVLDETPAYILLGTGECVPERSPPNYLQDAEEQLQFLNQERVERNPWTILFTNYTI